MPQYLCSQAHILADWRLETQLTRCYSSSIIFDCRLKRLNYSSAQVKVTLRLRVSQSVLVSSPIWGS
jgi:hypothetical protein